MSRSRWKEDISQGDEQGSGQGDPHRHRRALEADDGEERGRGRADGDIVHRTSLATSHYDGQLDRSTASTFNPQSSILVSDDGRDDSHSPLTGGDDNRRRSMMDNRRHSSILHPLQSSLPPSSSHHPDSSSPTPAPAPTTISPSDETISGKASSSWPSSSDAARYGILRGHEQQQQQQQQQVQTTSTISNDTNSSLHSSNHHPFSPLESVASNPPRLHPRFSTTSPRMDKDEDNKDMREDQDKDLKKMTGPTHTLEILSASPPDPSHIEHHRSATLQPRAPFSAEQRTSSRSRRRRFFRDPISTITSSIHQRGKNYKRRKNNNNINPATGTTTSSAAGLLSARSDSNSNYYHHPSSNATATTAVAALANSTTTAASGGGGGGGGGETDGLSSSTITKKDLAASSTKTGGTSPVSSPSLEAGTNGTSPINDINATNGVLRRVYDSWALIALSVANIGPIAGAFFGVHTAKEYGGYSMLAIGWPLSGLCMCLFSAVLAELSSSYPVAGAMFTWTFRTCRLSPTLRPFARYLSWLTGSLLLCGHILSQMLLEYQIATVLQGLIIIYAQNYVPTVWRTIGLAWGCLLISGSIAVTRMGRSPYLWKGVSILVGSTVIIIIVSVFACSPVRNPASFIFTSYRNETGWTSKGYVYLLGWVLTSIATGQDVASHLAEESKHPTKSVPMGVFWGTALSYLIGWIVMLCIMAVTPEDPHGMNVSRDYGAPAQMLTEVLPRPLAFVILLLIVILMLFQDIAQLLASSRFMWALARDSAIPFSAYLRRLTPGSQLPVRATWTVCIIAAPCLMLIAGSKQIVTSLILSGCGTSLVLAYTIPVLCYLTCPSGALDMDGRNEWTLRGASKYVAAFGCCYIGLIIVMMCCPNYFPVTSTSFSYAAPVIVFVLLLSSLTWILYGNSHYAGPIKSMTVYTIGREVELPKLTSAHSTNRNTPGSRRPTDPNNTSGPALTTEVEIGKTANLYSESLATMDLGRPETVDLSQDLVTRSWRSSELNTRNDPQRMTGPTDTQVTEYSEYTDGSYTDSESEDGSGSDNDEDATGGNHSQRAAAVTPQIPQNRAADRPAAGFR